MTKPSLAVRGAARGLALAMLCAALPLLGASPASADTQICEKFGTARIAGGQYVVQNNEWGDDTPQCLNVTDTGFTITTADHNKSTGGAPAAYPSIYAGCHYGGCSDNSGLPLQVSAFGDPRTSVNFNTVNYGAWDAAYDIWFDTNPNPAGQNNGAEVMIWGNHMGAPRPVGSQVGTTHLAGADWDVWEGPLSNAGITWNVVSYVRQQGTNSLDLHIKDFTNDSASRGYLSSAWYLTSVQFGFEPWVGGAGLGVNTFSFNASGGGGGTGGTIVGTGSGRCLDVRSGGTTNATPVQIYDCNGTAAQQWKRSGSSFANPNSGKCLDVQSGGTANGTPVQIYDCNGTGAQSWQVNGNGTIVNSASGKCLDVSGQAVANGTPLQIWDCNTYGQTNQTWTVKS